MKLTSDIVLKLLGILLLTAAVLKGWQLLTEPVTNDDIWSYRPFLILTVEFEIALGIWLLSSLFEKAAWLAAISCFSLFSAITFYKGITGAESCGCFGSVHVNPWITLFAIDIPAVIALILLPPKGEKLFDWPSIPHFAKTVCISLLVLSITTMVLAFNEPRKVTSEYEVLEPKTWISKRLPILEYIDIGMQLEKGRWLLLLYHHNCSDCLEILPQYGRISHDLVGHENILRIALLELPPYAKSMDTKIFFSVSFARAKLNDCKEWFVTTPVLVLMLDGIVQAIRETNVPTSLDAIWDLIEDTNLQKKPAIDYFAGLPKQQEL